MKLSNKVYDILKWISLMVIPLLAAGLVAVSEIWGLSLAPEVLGLLSAVGSVIGAVINISAAAYNRSVHGALKPSPVIQLNMILQAVTTYWLPAMAAAYYILSLFITVPYPGEIVRTIITVHVFLGLLIGVYSVQNQNLTEYFKKMIEKVFGDLRAKLPPSK